MMILSPEQVSPRQISGSGFLYLDSELLKPRYARPQQRVNSLDDPVQIVIFLWRWRRKLHMQ